MTTDDKFPIEVPACFIKDKAVDYDLELFAAMGASLPVGGFLVRAPSLGVFSLLETYESKFIADPTNCNVMEFYRMLYINEHRAECVQMVMDWAYPDKGISFDAENLDTWTAFDFAVHDWSKGIFIEDKLDDLLKPFTKVCEWFNIAFEGFDMIPSSGNSQSAMWFGADALGSLSQVMECTLNELLWEIPMCYVGHRMAASARFNGNENVGRKKDTEHLKQQMEEARERVRNGVLHPWQIKDPTNPAWPLTARQVEYAPHLKEEWDALIEEKKNVG